MGQQGVVLPLHHRAEVFFEEVNGQGGRTFRVNGIEFVDKGEPYSNRGYRLWSNFVSLICSWLLEDIHSELIIKSGYGVAPSS